jgi:hypothetical protein
VSDKLIRAFDVSNRKKAGPVAIRSRSHTTSTNF